MSKYACNCDPRIQQLQKDAVELRQGQVLSYYFDLTAKPIGNRPVIVGRTNPLVEPTIRCPSNVTNQPGRLFCCKQPHWCWKCA